MKPNEKIGVAVIGASPLNPGWGIKAHIPAIRALPDYELRAVGTNRPESAAAAAELFGVAAFTDVYELLAQPGVDLVAICVKAPEHHELISAALTQGKMVLSEWPLGINLNETVDLAARAVTAGVRTAIGLQARFAPAIQHARDLVKQGYIGEVLATTLVGSGIAWNGHTDRGHAYMLDQSSGVNVVSVPALHALDALHFVLGEFASASATLAVRRPTVQVAEDGTLVQATAPDHVAINGVLTSGAIASVFYRGGTSRGENLRWEINGTIGDLVVTSSVGNLQVADLLLEGGVGASTLQPINIPAEIAAESDASAIGIGANVLRLYAQFAHDIHHETNLVPDFAHGVRRHRELAAIEAAAYSGVSQNFDNLR